MLPRDFDQLAALVRTSGAACLIVDPIAAHFQPERRVHDRASLGKFIMLARSSRCAIVAIHHSTKVSVDGTALGAVGGPLGGLSGAARAVYLYGHDPADRDRRAMACVKINGVDAPPALIIEHETVEYSTGHALIEAGLLRFVDESNAEAKRLLKPGLTHRRRDQECAEWLSLYLATGDDFTRLSRDVREAGRDAGFGWQTVVRAGTDVKVVKLRVGWGGDGFWVWKLPEEHPLRQPPPPELPEATAQA